MAFSGVWRPLGAAAATSLLLLCGSARAVTFNWSGPIQVDRGQALASNQNLSVVSCPSAQLCVAIDRSGVVFTSIAPLGGGGGSWRIAGTVKGPVNALDCLSNGLCLAVTGTGDVLMSSDPGAAAPTWQRLHVASRGLVSLSCPTAGFCAAVDGARGVYTSTNPAGGAWRRTAFGTAKVRRRAGLKAVACASARFCLAVSGGGDVLSSPNPTGPAQAWRHTVLRRTQLTGAACPSSRLCLVLDANAQRVISSTNPTGPARAWRRSVRDDNGAFAAVICPSTRQCLVGDDGGSVYSSTSPAGGARAWRLAAGISNATGTAASYVSFSCASPRFCAAVNGTSVLTTTTPTSTRLGWSSVGIDADGGPSINDVSCPAAQLCVGVDDAGTVLTSTTPTAQGLWSRQANDGAQLVGVACAGISLCVAVDSSGGAFSSANPTGGQAAWSRASIDPGHTLTAVACPSAQLCVATDRAGRVVSTTNPTGGAGVWSAAKIDSSALTGISCSSPSLCVAAGVRGRVLASTNPSGGASAWRLVATDHNSGQDGGQVPEQSMSVACAPQGLCITGDAYGGLMSSTSPASGPWRFAEIDPDTGPDIEVTYYRLVSASCASNQLCAVIALGTADGSSDALTSSNPMDGNSWSHTGGIDDAYGDATAVSCPTTQLCIAVDDNGRALIGTGP